jgi:hypothetical protein
MRLTHGISRIQLAGPCTLAMCLLSQKHATHVAGRLEITHRLDLEAAFPFIMDYWALQARPTSEVLRRV